MPSDSFTTPRYRDPMRLPAEGRIGLTVEEPGQPFEHFCQVCGDRAPWGFGRPNAPEQPDQWFFREHRADGEAWLRPVEKHSLSTTFS